MKLMVIMVSQIAPFSAVVKNNVIGITKISKADQYTQSPSCLPLPYFVFYKILALVEIGDFTLITMHCK